MDAFLNCKKYILLFTVSFFFPPLLAIAQHQPTNNPTSAPTAIIKIGQSLATEGENKKVGLNLVTGTRT
jgi:hypothetical protein